MPIRAKLPNGQYITVPDDTTPEELDAIVNEQSAEMDGPPSPSVMDERGFLDRAVDKLPTVAGMIGGLTGAKRTPVGMAITGAAGAAGEGMRQGIRLLQGRGEEVPDTFGGALTRMGTEGLTQAATEGVGRGASNLMRRGGARLYQGLLKPSKAVREEFPDVIQTLLEARAPISGSGVRKVEGLTRRSSDQANQMIVDAAPAASRVRAGEVTSEFAPVIAELRKRMQIGQPSEAAVVRTRGRNLVREERAAGGYDLPRAQELKRTAQSSADAAYKARDRGTQKQLSADDLLDEATARGFRKAIETRVPQVAGVNRNTQSLIGAGRALEGATGREGNTLGAFGMRDGLALSAGGAAGLMSGDPSTGAGTAGLIALLSRPATGSRAAIGLNEAARAPIGQLLRALMLVAPSTSTPRDRRESP